MGLGIKKEQWLVAIAGLILLVYYSIFYSSRSNSEFMLYVGIMIFFFAVLLLTNKKVKYSNGLLWGLFIWALMHMLGGSVMINGGRLYDTILIPLSDTY